MIIEKESREALAHQHFVETLPICAAELLGRAKRDKETEPNWLEDRPIYIFARDSQGDGVMEYLALVDTEFNGSSLNTLLYRIAPNPRYGLDKEGMLDDWQLPEQAEDSSYYRDLLEQHIKHLSEDWQIFLKNRERFYDALKGNLSLIPMIRWQRDAGGKRSYIFDVLSADRPFEESLRRFAIESSVKIDTESVFWVKHFSPLTGLLAVSYFTPEVRANWPQNQCLGTEPQKQFMGPAQVPVLALQRKEEILESQFFTACEEYAKEDRIAD